MFVRTRQTAIRRGALLFAAAALLTSCNAAGVLTPEVDVGTQTSSVTASAAAPARGLQTLVPSNPYMSSYPQFVPELVEPAVMPAEEISCRKQLKRLGVSYTDLAPINDGGACAIDWPIKVSGLPKGIELKPAATLTCQMALAFSSWTKNELNSSARWRYFSGVKSIRQGSSYSCRRIAGTSVASEHSKGNALDIMSVTLNNGRKVDVRRPGLFAFRQRSLLNKVRAEGCGYFTTVLGPGYDADHKDHFHFDIKDRKNGYRACR